ncbi:hypothetical protein LL912_00910 [Niabella sp. CC-SYL272]|uniref:hypothetical protein n=1 Tax=Niabella agricola TaxID=2891571 RepID=UPI001F1CA74C|nr:hypothetical protein [Niabella agricola]MCF3107327.1 hypothetical protein [Niabella agricola]
MTGKYFLNGLDMYTQYGFVPAPGCSDDFLRFRQPKERPFNDWPEYSGKEYDTSDNPVYNDRVFTLRGHIVVSTESEFWTKWNALFTAFDKPGTQTVRVGEFSGDTTQASGFKVFMLEQPEIKRWTRLKDYPGKRAVEFTLKLQEVQNG